jgi:hypothetical protein
MAKGFGGALHIMKTCSRQTEDQQQRQVLAQLLQDAEDKLWQITDPDGFIAAE